MRSFLGGSVCEESACNAGDQGSILRSGGSGSEVKAAASNAGNPGLIPGLGRSPGEGNGYSLRYSCLESQQKRIWTKISSCNDKNAVSGSFHGE